MAIQKVVDLNKPLDADAKATLEKSSLKPELAQAALALHGDRYRQLQSRLNRFLFWHPVFIIVFSIAIPTVLTYKLWDYISISDSPVELLSFLIKSNDFRFQILASLPLLAAVMGFVGITCFWVSEELRYISDKMIQEGFAGEIFGFNIKTFSELPSEPTTTQDVKLYENGVNTQIILYRDSPIAICTVTPDLVNSTVENFIVKISGLHIRKVFAKVDFDDLLIDWSIFRAREIYQDYVKSKNVKKVDDNKLKIVVDSYSFDKKFESTLLAKNFVIVDESLELNPYKEVSTKIQKLIHSFFGVSRRTLELDIITTNEDAALLEKAVKESSFLRHESITSSATEVSTPKGVRKRKS
ncbi:hypothetical protein G9P44_002669 [Scheffersomyces stipitis]|nr:hypothetical protein G9P44_002669 [Scheffersomyces stipitis]